MLSSAFVAPIFAVGVLAQAGPWTDPNSGITLQTEFTRGPSFGLVLPPNPETDFIAQIVGKGKGWTGISLGGSMSFALLITAWPHGNSLVSGFRQVESYSYPDVTTGNFTMRPIPSGTYVNETHYSFTFLCAGCIRTDRTTFGAGDEVAVIGWAESTAAPATPSDSASRVVQHQTEGLFGLQLAGTKSEKYAEWAALAE